MKTLVISPTYNERKNISSLIENVFAADSEFHLLIVDDNSPDGTAKIVEDLMKRHSNLFLKQRPGKAGLGTAYLFGFKWALERNYDAIIQIDADMSHDPSEIREMIPLLEHNDLIIGSRYCEGASIVRWPFRRLVLSSVANLYVRMVTGLPVKDGTGGYKIWKRKVLECLNLDQVRSEGYSFQIEMNFRTWQREFKIVEHPIVFTDRTIGESKMSWSIIFEAMIIVWRLLFWRIFHRRDFF